MMTTTRKQTKTAAHDPGATNGDDLLQVQITSGDQPTGGGYLPT
jgi:hypothetical protein